MATLTIRNVDPEIHSFLRQRAAANGRSMEAETRAILKQFMIKSQIRPIDAAKRIHALFARIGGADDLVKALPKRRIDDLCPVKLDK